MEICAFSGSALSGNQQHGRILIDPQGRLSEGGTVPREYLHGSPEACATIDRANRAYFQARHRWRADRQIRRAVTMLGTRTANGWIVLEGRA